MTERVITFAESGIAYQIRVEGEEAIIEAVGPGEFTRRASIPVEQDEIERLIESPHGLSSYAEDRLRRFSAEVLAQEEESKEKDD